MPCMKSEVNIGGICKLVWCGVCGMMCNPWKLGKDTGDDRVIDGSPFLARPYLAIRERRRRAMRQTQKFQLILACSALLFCLSPIANRWLPMHAHTPVHYAARVEDRGGPPLPLIADELGSMRWVRTATGHEDVQIYAISAKSDRLYAPLAQALATAAPVKQPAQGVTFP
jgi:hypothetical protein